MGFIVPSSEMEKFLILKEENSWVSHLWRCMKQRVLLYTKNKGIIQSGDTHEWWHLIEERVSDAAFVYLVTKNKEIAKWIHDTVLEICRLDVKEWVGPWFRTKGDTPSANLETAHICVAVSTALDLCDNLFDDKETEEIKNALREKGLLLCYRFLENSKNENKHNWHLVILDGYATAATVLNDKFAIDKACSIYCELKNIFNSDSYGESLQYWNYASLKMAHTWEMLHRYDSSLTEMLEMPYASCVPWACSSLMFLKSSDEIESQNAQARSINFADTASMFRISGDLALHIARRCMDTQKAGLSRWLFEYSYQEAQLIDNSGSTFGFLNNFGFLTLLNYALAANTVTPAQFDLPLSVKYDVGHMIIKDKYLDPDTILGIQGGYNSLCTASHRHADLNSFILAHKGEVFFADPGHCCYRTMTNNFTKSNASHSNLRFITESGKILEQQMVTNDNKSEILCKQTIYLNQGSITISGSDCANAYGQSIKKAERVFVSVLPNVLFIIDTVESDIPLAVEANFVVNNQDNLTKYHVASSDRLVLRRNHAALKFFLCKSTTPCSFSHQYTTLHDYYHPNPNQEGQGKDGSGIIFTHKSEFSYRHQMVYAIAMSDEPSITGWHIYQNNSIFEVEAPNGTYKICLNLNQNIIQVVNHKTNEEVVANSTY